eukprot:6185693-Pleurochrysis_carterae.AAC.4
MWDATIESATPLWPLLALTTLTCHPLPLRPSASRRRCTTDRPCAALSSRAALQTEVAVPRESGRARRRRRVTIERESPSDRGRLRTAPTRSARPQLVLNHRQCREHLRQAWHPQRGHVLVPSKVGELMALAIFGKVLCI